MSFAEQGAELGVGLVGLGIGASIAEKAVDSSRGHRATKRAQKASRKKRKKSKKR